MSNVKEFFEEKLGEDEEPSMLFAECFGEHAMNEVIRDAIVCASTQKFGGDLGEFTESTIALSLSINFHGPYIDITEAIEDSEVLTGVIVAPAHLWEPEFEFVYVAVLAN